MGLKTPPQYLENSNPFIFDQLAGVGAAPQSFGVLEMNFNGGDFCVFSRQNLEHCSLLY